MSFFVKQDYELQLVAYKAHVDPLASPLKKSKLDSASDNIIQEVCFLEPMWDTASRKYFDKGQPNHEVILL